MLNIPNSIKNLLNSDRCWKNFRVRFPNGELPDITNAQVVQESVRFTESLCSRDVLKFGLTEASVIEFETVGVGNMYGMMIEAFCEVKTSSLSSAEISSIQSGTWDGELIPASASDIGFGFFRIPYGVFRVESCPRNSDIVPHRKVTAYSLSYARLSKSFPAPPEIAAWPDFIIDPAAFLDQLDETRLIEADMTGPEAAQGYIGAGNGELYNQTGTRFTLGDKAAGSSNIYRRLYRMGSADFIKVNIEYDKDAYEAAGMAVVNAIVNAGYDLSRTIGGGKNYPNTEAAIRDRYPELFAPVIWMQGNEAITSGGSTQLSTMDGPLWSQALVNDRLIPVAGYSSFGNTYPFAFSGAPSDKNIVSIQPLIVFYPESVEAITLIRSASTVLEIPVRFPPVKFNSMKYYQREIDSNIRVKLTNTAPAQQAVIGRASSTSSLRLPRYSYVDAYDREALLDGYLELNAIFGKVNRQGKLQGLRLSTENPVSVIPSQYSEVWWDEFDVSPIGSVIFSYTEEDEQQTISFIFGSGASVYDLSNNAVINALEESTLEKIQAILRENFVPNLLPVSFTPIELTMQGLPYFEDGDYMTVTGADGTLTHSFNMRHELSGIQALEAEVTSVSGQIIDSEVI